MFSIKNFSSFAVSKSSKHVSTQSKEACQKSFQPKARFQDKCQKCYSSLLLFTFTIQALFKHGSTIHGYYSRFLFCLFKEARSSFVSRFNLGSYALPSLFFLSHHVTSSSFQAFSKLSSSFLPLSIVRYFSLCII